MASSSDSIHIVTGASRGIGRATARELSRRGCRVLAVARSRSELDELRSECGSGLTCVTADLATFDGRQETLNAIPHGTRVSSLVHGAGSLVIPEDYGKVDPEALVAHFRIHVAVPQALTAEIARRFDLERVLFIDSYSASDPRVGWSAYSVVKAAAQMHARCAGVELEGTRVIRLFPGAVRTQVVEAVLRSDTPTASVFEAMVRQGKCVPPETCGRFIADVLLNLSDEALDRRSVWDFNQSDQVAEAGAGQENRC